MAPPDDPFPPVITAISAVLAKPNTPYDTGAATPPDPALAATVTGLMNVLYSASADMKSVGAAAATALASVAKVLGALADSIRSASVLPSESQLQSTLTTVINEPSYVPPAVAQTLLSSGVSLSSQLQDFLAAQSDTADAADELDQLVQQLNLIAKEIQPQ